MELYNKTSKKVSRLIMQDYSSSFGMSSRLFSTTVRSHIYALYALTRIADEVVDSYIGSDARELLSQLQRETYQAIDHGYSTNPVVHSFALSANQFGIGHNLIEPFFESMAMDLSPHSYTKKLYEQYIYGSAEVIGLMCLKVFCNNDDTLYNVLKDGARHLGAGYQKVNFLRDMKVDHDELGRLYFPSTSFETFDEADKQAIIADIQTDFAIARQTIKQLPASAQKAITLSYTYYSQLLSKLEKTPVGTIKSKRIRLGGLRKLTLLCRVGLGLGL